MPDREIGDLAIESVLRSGANVCASAACIKYGPAGMSPANSLMAVMVERETQLNLIKKEFPGFSNMATYSDARLYLLAISKVIAATLDG